MANPCDIVPRRQRLHQPSNWGKVIFVNGPHGDAREAVSRYRDWPNSSVRYRTNIGGRFWLNASLADRDVDSTHANIIFFCQYGAHCAV